MPKTEGGWTLGAAVGKSVEKQRSQGGLSWFLSWLWFEFTFPVSEHSLLEATGGGSSICVPAPLVRDMDLGWLGPLMVLRDIQGVNQQMHNFSPSHYLGLSGET